jgi:tetratricopeptide (TPR) repeat protein
MGIRLSFPHSRWLFLWTACALSMMAVVAGGAAFASSPTRLPALSSRVLMADDYYLGRAKLSNVQQAIDLLRQAANENPRDYEVWWRIAKFENFLGRRTEDDRTADGIYRAGVEAAQRAVALQPNRVEGHFWLGANYGLMAETEGWIKGLRLLDTVRSEMETVIRLDPNYEASAGERTLARIFYRAPFFKGGDKQRSIELLQDCLKRYPHDSFAMLYLADDYLAVGRRSEARALLEQILGLCPDPLYGPELENNQVEARERLEQEFRAAR